ncbi:ABC transporter permease [Rhodoferax sp. WC2427]|uniref:ABC transporter permease n=1 Tax=Rhodoferax sp. WC2427 TaxID=3234144 RepID=UPI0034658E27
MNISATADATALRAPSVGLGEDSRILKARLRRAERMGQFRAYLLVLPLLVFLLFTFIVPIGNLLLKSVKDTTLSEELPQTSAALQLWNPQQQELPPEEVFATFAAELAAKKGTEGPGKVAMRLNYDEAGMRSLILKTVRGLDGLPQVDWREHLAAIDPRWSAARTWVTLKYAARTWTIEYYLKALDLTRDDHGAIVQQPEELRLYRDVFVRTAWVGLSVSALCLLLGYPVAYFLATLPPRMSNVLMILVLLPFWTSFLVRSVSWMVILQSNGVLNGLLSVLGISASGWNLIYNRWGVLISMTHILMPYAILSLYSVMKNIPPIYMRAARSLGAGPARAFFSAYFPHSLPGVAAGGMLTFILAVGYYITPAMLGGPDDQLVSYYIANHVNTTLNWGLAAALAAMLLVGVTAMYAVFVRLTGGSGVKLG